MTCAPLSPPHSPQVSTIGTRRRLRLYDVILGALVQTIAKWGGGKAAAIHLSHQGRDPRLSGVNLSRTFGCLISDFSDVFRVDSAQDLRRSMR